MANEIERRWLVENPPAEALGRLVFHIEQGYLPTGLRTRKTTVHGDDGQELVFCHLTVKNRLSGMTNEEIEVEVPEAIHRTLWAFENKRLTKKRRFIPHGQFKIELDEFEDGMFIAEIELKNEDDFVEVPEWFGREITGDKSLTNYALAKAIG